MLPSCFLPKKSPFLRYFPVCLFLLCFSTAFKKLWLRFVLFFFASPPLSCFPHCKNPPDSSSLEGEALFYRTHDAVHSIYLLHCSSQFKYIFPTIYRQTLYSQWGCVCVGAEEIHIMEELTLLHFSISSHRKNLWRITTSANSHFTFPSKVVAREEGRDTPV